MDSRLWTSAHFSPGLGYTPGSPPSLSLRNRTDRELGVPDSTRVNNVVDLEIHKVLNKNIKTTRKVFDEYVSRVCGGYLVGEWYLVRTGNVGTDRDLVRHPFRHSQPQSGIPPTECLLEPLSGRERPVPKEQRCYS